MQNLCYAKPRPWGQDVLESPRLVRLHLAVCTQLVEREMFSTVGVQLAVWQKRQEPSNLCLETKGVKPLRLASLVSKGNL